MGIFDPPGAGCTDCNASEAPKLCLLASDPTGPDVGKGSIYFNTTTNTVKVHDGTQFRDVTVS